MIARSEDLFRDGQTLPSHDLRIAAIPRERQEDPRRYSSGLYNVDDSTGLYQPGEFIVIGAREGEGKTVLAEKIGLYNSSEHRVLLASFDMAPSEVQDRCLSKTMLMSAADVNELAQKNAPEFIRGMQMLKERDFMVWCPTDHRERSVRGIISHAEKVTAAILMIDYAALIDGWVPGNDARKIVNYLKDWAKSSLVTTILLAQLRDEAASRRPNSSHLQDTSALRQRADRVVLLYRPFRGKRHKDTVAEVITTKNRFGEESLNHIGWLGPTTDFYAMDAEEEAHARCCYKPGK